MDQTAAIQFLHDRCAVFTTLPTAAKLLDLVGWVSHVDLTSAVLLEPCVGEGAILLEAATRLVRSTRAADLPLNPQTLSPRIHAFELHPATASIARAHTEQLLIREGLSNAHAHEISASWIEGADFLLAEPCSVTHVAANPPYLRWSKVPRLLSEGYRSRLPGFATRGDIAIAFLDRMQAWARDRGRVAALVSDRWMYAQYGAEFLAWSAKEGWLLEVIDERADRPFVRHVGAYPTIVRLSRRDSGSDVPKASGRADARNLHGKLIERHGTLLQAGCSVRVGPALGCGSLYLLDRKQGSKIEIELLREYVDRAGLVGQTATASDKVLVSPFNLDGELVSLEEYPGFARWAATHRSAMMARSQFLDSKVWWRTIDTIGKRWQETPKLLLPELCREPQVFLDDSAAIPAHSLYAIWPGEWPIDTLQRLLNGGLLSLTARSEAPQVGSGWFRFYKRFIDRTPLPKWSSLTPKSQQALSNGDDESFSREFRQLFDFLPIFHKPD